MEQIFYTVHSFGIKIMENKNLLLFRDNYGQKLFLFNVTFSRLLSMILDYSSNGITRVIKKQR